MKVAILIEPAPGGGFQAKAGEPFGMSAQGATADEAARQLETALRERLRGGGRLAYIDLGNGPDAPLRLPPVADDDWAFQAMMEAIVENRRREDEMDT
jgi:predicted RNase H-like HicB family nuclease